VLSIARSILGLVVRGGEGRGGASHEPGRDQGMLGPGLDSMPHLSGGRLCPGPNWVARAIGWPRFMSGTCSTGHLKL
jgi:hypothetical protein